MSENRRDRFRIDDVLPVRDRPLSTQEFEEARHRIGVRARQCSMLRKIVGRDVFDREAERGAISPELADALGSLDAKLDYLISLNMVNDANRYGLEERPVNLSASGCAFTTDEAYRVGDPLEVVLMLPVFPPIILELLAEVVRVEQVSATRWRIGVRFFFRSEDEEEAITRYVFRRHREQIRMRRAEETAGADG